MKGGAKASRDGRAYRTWRGMMPKWPCHSFVPRGFVDQAPARVTGGQPRAAAVVIYCVAFLTGAIVMSFEMLGSRYLSPYFGGGIYTWAALISTVLIALTAGYFVGGILADRTISASVLALIVIAGSGYLLVLPSFAQPVLEFALDSINDIRAGSLIASLSLMLVPVTFFGMCSPFAVRLLLRSAKSSGRVAGAVYGISTAGSIAGTLGTTFFLIPAIGSRGITLVLGAVGLFAGLAMLAVSGRGRATSAMALAALLVLRAPSGHAQGVIDESVRAAMATRADGRIAHLE